MNTNKAQTWYIGTAVVAVLVLVAGWFLLVAPAKSNASDLQAQADSVVQQNAATQVQLDQLKAQSKNLPAQEAQIAAIQTRIPTNPALPTLIRTLSDQAKAAGVSLDSLTPGTPTLASGSTTGTATATTATPVAPGKVSQIPVSLKVTGNFANVRLFLNGLESMQRAFLVTGLAIAQNAAATTTATAGSLSTTITGDVFMAPQVPIPSTPNTTAATAAG
jgi:Tfp pilus assembly protein PilO